MESLTDAAKAAADRAFDACIAAVTADDDRYPHGGAFIGEDHPDFAVMAAESLHEGKPLIVVGVDGSETYWTPARRT